jgi:hypothetical protein
LNIILFSDTVLSNNDQPRSLQLVARSCGRKWYCVAAKRGMRLLRSMVHLHEAAKSYVRASH